MRWKIRQREQSYCLKTPHSKEVGMITLRTGSHALNIITLLSVTGEFPMRSLKLLGNERVLKALVHKMTTPQDYRLPHTQTEERITCKLLNVSGKGSSKSIRFSKAASSHYWKDSSRMRMITICLIFGIISFRVMQLISKEIIELPNRL